MEKMKGLPGIANMREAHNMTQEDLANRLNVSAITVSRWETGRQDPGVKRLIEIAELFGCTKDDLIGNPTEAPVRRRRTTGASTHSAA